MKIERLHYIYFSGPGVSIAWKKQMRRATVQDNAMYQLLYIKQAAIVSNT